MRIGITLPIFSSDATRVLDVAAEAEERGIDGVFVFDHLWPMGDPTRPALSLYPTLGAVAAATKTITVGSLVARIGLLPDEVVAASLESMHELAPGRFLAALGTGDKASEPENERLGLPVLGAATRRASLARVANRLCSAGVQCWVGAGAAATNEIARDLQIPLNFWDVPADRLASEVAVGAAVTWGGPLPKDTGAAASKLRELAAAGSGWAVWGWPRSLQAVVDAREAVGDAPVAGKAAPESRGT